MPTSTPTPNTNPNPESNFRNQLTGFKWARSVHDDSNFQNNSPSNPGNGTLFSKFMGSISGYVPLRSNERSNEEEAYYALSRWERTIGFLFCITGASICFLIASLTLPLLAFKPRKFVISFSLGSLLFMIGFIILQGPIQHFQHIFSLQRLPFTLSYFISLFATFYFSIGLHSYLGTLIAGIVQVIALISYLVAYFPGGLTTLKFMGSMGLRGATSYLPI